MAQPGAPAVQAGRSRRTTSSPRSPGVPAIRTAPRALGRRSCGASRCTSRPHRRPADRREARRGHHLRHRRAPPRRLARLRRLDPVGRERGDPSRSPRGPRDGARRPSRRGDRLRGRRHQHRGGRLVAEQRPRGGYRDGRAARLPSGLGNYGALRWTEKPSAPQDDQIAALLTESYRSIVPTSSARAPCSTASPRSSSKSRS